MCCTVSAILRWFERKQTTQWIFVLLRLKYAKVVSPGPKKRSTHTTHPKPKQFEAGRTPTPNHLEAPKDLFRPNSQSEQHASNQFTFTGNAPNGKRHPQWHETKSTRTTFLQQAKKYRRIWSEQRTPVSGKKPA